MKWKVVAAVMAVLLVCCLAPAVAAQAEPKTPELSLEQAISRALSNSLAVERAVLDVVYAEDVSDSAKLAAYRWNPNYTTVYTPGTEYYIAAIMTADFNYEAAKKQEELQRDMVVTETEKRYYDILLCQERIVALEAELSAEEQKFRITGLMFEAGMVPRIAFDQASLQLNQKRAELAAAENDLENAFVVFNQLVGLKPDDRPVLTDRPVFEELNVENLSSTVSQIVKDNPAQWIADEGVDLQEELEGFTGASSEQHDIKVEQAELDADMLREETRKGAYKIYYGIKSLEEAYQTAQAGVRLAEDSLRITRLKYEVGMATQADVAAAEAAVIQAQQKLFELTCQHKISKTVFYKPWTAAVLM